MSKIEKTEKTSESRYKMKGTPIEVYLTENGEFQWTPAPEACSDNDSIREFLDVLKGMPQAKGAVWGNRINKQETAKRCQLIKQEIALQNELDAFLASLGSNPNKLKQDGGEKSNGQE